SGVAALHSKGFNGCGVQEITEAAGVPKGSFYNYFESKEAFSAEVLEHYWENGAQKNLAVLSDESIPALTRLRTYFNQRAAVHDSGHYERGCMLGNLSTEITGQSRLVRDRLAGMYAGWVRVVGNCLREARQNGEYDSDLDPMTLASFLVNAWQGAIMRAKVDRDSTSIDQFMEVVFNQLLAKGQSASGLASLATASAADTP
ncbi:MAG TPA: TetR family transcriptional regulator C-terminal domain-containing protein, partial [Chthoniobacteraceae bacterium]|nr:TetR family transcriptional regulator C-terminal domain-containing protein [Chthoniobacteraceae bacterium]